MIYCDEFCTFKTHLVGIDSQIINVNISVITFGGNVKLSSALLGVCVVNIISGIWFIRLYVLMFDTFHSIC